MVYVGNENKGEVFDCINMWILWVYLIRYNLNILSVDFSVMGNFVDILLVEVEEFFVGIFLDLDMEFRVDDYVIDLDVFEYYEYFMERKKSLSEGVLFDDVIYLDWKRNNNVLNE